MNDISIDKIIRDFQELKEKYLFIDSLLNVSTDYLIKVRIKTNLIHKSNKFDYIIWSGKYIEFKNDLSTLCYITNKYQTLIQEMYPASPRYFYIKYISRNKLILTKVNQRFKPNIFERLFEFFFL